MEKNTLGSMKKSQEQRIEELKKQLEILKTKRERIGLIVLIVILATGMIITAKMAVAISNMSLSEAALSLVGLIGGSGAVLISSAALSDIFFEREKVQLEGDISTAESILNWIKNEQKTKLKENNQRYTHNTKIEKSVERLTEARQRLLSDQERAATQPIRKAPRQLTLGARKYYRTPNNYKKQNK